MRRSGLCSGALLLVLLTPAAALAVPARSFEGPALAGLPSLAAAPPPDPEIAAGPDDLLIGVRSDLFRLPNPNGLGRHPSVDLNAAHVSLDTWLGETAVSQLCPTQPRSDASCVIDNLTVRYDQMQGRFVVLFTVVNTGLNDLGMFVGDRKASWVLLVSRQASLAARDNPSGAGVFIGTGGGVNRAVWDIWYGNSVTALGSDGFGGPTANGISNGNINAINGIPGATNPALFDCRRIAIGDATRVCYLPTSARLGIDNDSITITSAVLNDNIPVATRGPTPILQPAYGGTRVRVLKKTSIYTAPIGGRALVAGNQFAGTDADRLIGDYYDLYTAVDAVGTPIAANPVMPYTIVASAAGPPAGPSTPPAADNRLSPLLFEPAQLRGRPLASFANPPAGSSSQSYSLGAIATPFSALNAQTASSLYVLGIEHVRPTIPAPADGPIDFYPSLTQPLQKLSVDVFSDPRPAVQATARTGATPPTLFVGDDRPERVIFREGQLYDARTVALRDRYRLDGARLETTVVYDVVQKPGVAEPPHLALAAQWQNARTFAPMFDVPATVATSGQVSPVNVAAFLERLFVATGFPPLPALRTGSRDPRYREAETGALIPLNHCVGASPGAGLSLAAWPSLFDLRCGEDAFDSQFVVRDPSTGAADNLMSLPPVGAKAPFSRRGGACTDPNFGSNWVIGTYARLRTGSIPPGSWGTYVANYPVRVPIADQYGNPTQVYDDIPAPKSAAKGSTFAIAQIASQLGLGPSGPDFGVKDKVTRSEAARLIVLAQMDETALTVYLATTGGNTQTFSDVPPGSGDFRYIEAMGRRGYDHGCGGGSYCPTALVTRAQIATAVVRAKLGNVFPSVIAGCPPGAPITDCNSDGDHFGSFVPTELYYKDNVIDADNSAFPYIQKWGELRLDDVGVPKKNGLKGKFGPTKPMTRLQLVQVLIRAFFI